MSAPPPFLLEPKGGEGVKQGEKKVANAHTRGVPYKHSSFSPISAFCKKELFK